VSAGPLTVSVVVPVYCSASTLPALLDRLRTTLEALGVSWEIVLVDDGSPDGTWETIARLRAETHGGVVAVRLMRNYGQHNALMCGFRHARGDLIVTLDDDLQNPPEEIPKLLDALDAGDCDLVYGMYNSKEHRSWRNAASRAVNVFYRLVFRTGVTVTSFRAMRRPLMECILRYDLNFTFIDGLLAWNTQRIAAVPVAHHPRASNRSGYSPAKLATLALNLFTNFSLLPLQLVTALGLLLAGGGFAVGILYLVLFLQGKILVPGYASTITAILVLGGAQLIALGIFGEYLGRLHMNVNRKPQYAERQILGAPLRSAEPKSLAAGSEREAVS
jgi:glycosyltransferase involved in cell wall biosynthesis